MIYTNIQKRMLNVNISHTLLKNQIERGTKFVEEKFFPDGQFSVNVFHTIQKLPLGLFTNKNYQPGEIVHQLQGKLVLKPDKESIHIGNNLHVIDKYGKFINHSFEPNTRIENNKVVAIKSISKNEEITFNYNDSGASIEEPFEVDGQIVCGTRTDGRTDGCSEKN
jgi:hypothetical protein